MKPVIKNTVLSIMGGMSWSLVEVMDSMVLVIFGGYPAFFIVGIVNEPIAATLATELPLTMPKRELAKISWILSNFK